MPTLNILHAVTAVACVVAASSDSVAFAALALAHARAPVLSLSLTVATATTAATSTAALAASVVASGGTRAAGRAIQLAATQAAALGLRPRSSAVPCHRVDPCVRVLGLGCTVDAGCSSSIHHGARACPDKKPFNCLRLRARFLANFESDPFLIEGRHRRRAARCRPARCTVTPGSDASRAPTRTLTTANPISRAFKGQG